ncbi:MAG: BNR-4 repeat-containing protein [Pseudomonadota bacterium]|nr:BNR-4 repeat-containing protein [Pseudomonadota bacterium]
MTVFTKVAVDVFAPTDAAGNLRRVVNGEAQVWGAEVERAIRAAISAGAFVYGTKAELDADLAHDEHTGAWVVADPDPANNGIYEKVGAAGTGSWEWRSGIPTGPKGWSPILRIITDGPRRVLEVYDWTGGEGVKPTETGYVGASGLTPNIADAIDVRGPQGVPGTGLAWNFDVGTVDENPGSGNLRADDVDLSSATYLYASKLTAGGDDVSGFLLNLINSTSTHKGYLILTDPASESQVVFDVTGVTDATAYVKLAVTGQSGASAFDDAVHLSAVFTRTGNAGDLNGVSPGTTGLNVLEADTQEEAQEAIGVLPPPQPGQSYPQVNDGAWCWFADPRGVRYVGNADKTYYAFVENTYDGNSNQVIASYDHSTGEQVKTVLRVRTGIFDDHDAPAVLVRADGRIVVFYPQHNGGELKYKISTNPEDVSAFGVEQTVNAGRQPCYPNPVMLSAESNRIYVFYCDRTDQRNIYYSYSDDQASSFSAPVLLVDGGGDFPTQGIYFKTGNDGVDRVDFAITGAVGGRDAEKRDVRHFRFSAGAVYTAGGASLGALPLAFESVPLVYDTGAPNGNHVWVWDCSTNGGNPQVVYVEFPSKNEHVYRYARWDGAAWQDERLSNAGSTIAIVGGERYYSPGICLDHDRDAVLYASFGNTSKTTLKKLTRNSLGKWISRDLNTFGDGNYRPFVPRNADPELSVMWMAGKYHHYLSSRTKLIGIPGGAQFEPYAENLTAIVAALSTSVSVTANDTWNNLVFDQLDDHSDLKGEFDTTDGSFTARMPGYYMIALSIGYSSSSDCKPAIELLINGVRRQLLANTVSPSGVGLVLAVSQCAFPLRAGDEVRLRVFGGASHANFTIDNTASGARTYLRIIQMSGL